MGATGGILAGGQGPRVHVSGTTATDAEGSVVAAGDPHGQTVRAVVSVAGAPQAPRSTTRADPDVRGRHRDWTAVGDAQASGDVRPATTMVEASRLVDPDLLVGVEATALVVP